MKGFIKKEFLQIFRDVRSMVILFGIPIVQILLFGFALNMEVKNVDIAIYDKAQDEYSQKLTRKIISSEYFALKKNIYSMHEIEEEFRSGNIKEVLIIEPSFTENLLRNGTSKVQIITDASDPNMANLMTNYTRSIIQTFQMEEFAIREGKGIQVIAESRMRNNPELKSVFMFVPGVITIILMLVSAMMTSISIAREKELGTMEVLLVSPIKPIQIIIGKVMPYVLLSFINSIIILLLSYYVFEMPFSGSMVLLLAEILLFIIMALALGILISTVSNSQQTAMLLSMFALLLPTILLSGFIFPIKNMPFLLQMLSHLMPPKWFVVIIKGILIKGAGIEQLWRETLVLVGMTIAFIGLSVKKFKIRLQ